MKTYFVDVILPLAIVGTYTYRVPGELNEGLAVGKRVVVQFGKTRVYSAVISKIHQTPPDRYQAKYLLDILDEYPVVTSEQLSLWDWIASYYLCQLGEVMQAALPSVLKLASETKIIAEEGADKDRSQLDDREFLVMEALDLVPELRVNDIIKILGQKTILPVLKSLLEKDFIRISEEVVERYKPKKKTFVSLNPIFNEPEAKKELLDSLERAYKQSDAILSYLQMARTQEQISKAELLEQSGCGSSAFAALVKKEVFIVEEKVVSRLASSAETFLADVILSDIQQSACDDIKAGFTKKGISLLHGVTASGKTEIYIKLIQEVLDRGETALYLLPEIALTTQIVERLRLHFGSAIGAYHSRLNENERAEIWNRVLHGEIKVVLGARSSVFLPFQNLGLVVVDEEHEVSYKQFDPSPRYQARDTAIYLGALHRSNVLLGSATPSLESYYNAKAGKYALVKLDQRYGNAKLPDIEIVNLKVAQASSNPNPYFTSTLMVGIQQALEKKEQVILFQNRRGHTPMLLCATCGYSPKCIHCDVSLTYHKSSGQLHCHYCGFKESLIEICPACGSTHIESKGFGTQRIEEELSMLLPDVRIGRLDLDSTRTKNSFEKILDDFDEQRFDVLIGTQMVTKGLDFGKVSLIGIINADSLINYPDFRAFERSFSMLAQVGGRAGRRDVQGQVIIQAYATTHRILEQVVNHDYEEMFQTEIVERKKFSYPPFFRLIRIDVKHKDPHLAADCAQRFARELRVHFGEQVLGPEPPLVGRIRNYYIQSILLKFSRASVSIAKVKDVLKQNVLSYHLDKLNKGSRLTIDVDPY